MAPGSATVCLPAVAPRVVREPANARVLDDAPPRARASWSSCRGRGSFGGPWPSLERVPSWTWHSEHRRRSGRFGRAGACLRGGARRIRSGHGRGGIRLCRPSILDLVAGAKVARIPRRQLCLTGPLGDRAAARRARRRLARQCSARAGRSASEVDRRCGVACAAAARRRAELPPEPPACSELRSWASARARAPRMRSARAGARGLGSVPAGIWSRASRIGSKRKSR